MGFTGKQPDAEAEAKTGWTALEHIDLRERLVVFDALHTQRATVERIIVAGGCCLALVKNQPTLREMLEEGLDWSRCRGSMT